MSLPRQIIPGACYLISRRVAQRQFLLRPGPITNQLLLYALAYAAKVTGVHVHAFVGMSNHIHCVVTDPHGNLPKFLHALDRLIACCMNALLGRKEAFWSSDPPSIVPLEGDDDVIDHVAYVIANPTAAGLVAEPSQWPGVTTPVCGLRMDVARPNVFFSKKGKMPKSVELTVMPPNLASCDGVHDVLERLRAALDEKLRLAAAAVVESGRAFLGRARVLATDIWSTASKPEPVHSREPRFAARATDLRRRAIERLRAFYARYAAALESWRTGDRDAVFPPGTYMMRVRYGVVVDEPFG